MTLNSIIGSSISFAARPKYLSSSGEWVTVRWKYVDEPSENDWIGVFTPPLDDVYPINPSQQAPIKWKVTGDWEIILLETISEFIGQDCFRTLLYWTQFGFRTLSH